MVIVTVVFVVYFVFVAALLAGWNRRPDVPSPSGGREPRISIIVPVRNEERNLGALLDSLAALEDRNFEVIVVDDHSEDETVRIVTEASRQGLRLIPNEGHGKKSAITTGVRSARGSIIAVTDGDCRVAPGWLKEIRRHFHDPRRMLVFGGVRLEGDESFFHKLQEIEFASLMGSGAATALLGVPTMCNGANMAFRKKAFREVGGYQGNLFIPSGDDEFLMRKIRKRFPAGVGFMRSQDALVTTRVQPDLRSLLNQRIRWASKWKYNSSVLARLTAVFVVGLQVAAVVNLCLIFTPAVRLALFLLSVKLILEGAFLLQVCRFSRVSWRWTAFFALQVLYPPYVIGVSIASFFYGFEWKKRIFKPQ